MLLLNVSGAYDNVLHELLKNVTESGLGAFVPWVR